MQESSLPEELVINILSRHSDDFLFRLATMGVCKQWRQCSRWVDSLVFQYSRFKGEDCKKHGASLDGCDCVHDALSRILASSHSLKKLVLEEDETSSPSSRVNVLQPAERVLKGLRVCKLINVPLTDSVIGKLVKLCSTLEHLEIHDMELLTTLAESERDELTPLLNDLILDAPNLIVFCLNTLCGTVTLNAPKLREMYLLGAKKVITEGTSLQHVTLASATALNFTGRIHLQKLKIRGPSWHMESIRACLRNVPTIRWLFLCPGLSINELPASIYDFFHELKELKELEINLPMLMALDYDSEIEGGVFENLKLITVHVKRLYPQIDDEELTVRSICDLLFQSPVVRKVVIQGESRAYRNKLNEQVFEVLKSVFEDEDWVVRENEDEVEAVRS